MAPPVRSMAPPVRAGTTHDSTTERASRGRMGAESEPNRDGWQPRGDCGVRRLTPGRCPGVTSTVWDPGLPPRCGTPGYLHGVGPRVTLTRGYLHGVGPRVTSTVWDPGVTLTRGYLHGLRPRGYAAG